MKKTRNSWILTIKPTMLDNACYIFKCLIWEMCDLNSKLLLNLMQIRTWPKVEEFKRAGQCGIFMQILFKIPGNRRIYIAQFTVSKAISYVRLRCREEKCNRLKLLDSVCELWCAWLQVRPDDIPVNALPEDAITTYQNRGFQNTTC